LRKEIEKNKSKGKMRKKGTRKKVRKEEKIGVKG
jgi:hypothetical protein